MRKVTRAAGGVAILATIAALETGRVHAAAGPPPSAAMSAQRAVLDKYCVTCHNQRLKTSGLALDTLDLQQLSAHTELGEKIVPKLRGGTMPPPGAPRPDPDTYAALRTWFETELDRTASASPNPGRTQSLHRLNRAEYRNVIRDLLALDVDVADLLPGDDGSYGF